MADEDLPAEVRALRLQVAALRLPEERARLVVRACERAVGIRARAVAAARLPHPTGAAGDHSWEMLLDRLLVASGALAEECVAPRGRALVPSRVEELGDVVDRVVEWYEPVE